MPITTLGSYITAMDEFGTHWGLVNTELGLPMVLQGNYGLIEFTADRDALEAAMILIVGLVNGSEMAGGTRDSTRTAIRERLRQFRAQVQTLLPGSVYEAALPDLAGADAGEGVLLPLLDDMNHLWGQIDADTTTAGFTPPLLLAGGYPLATFTADLAGMRSAFKAVRDGEKGLQVERARRDAMLPPARERMKQYQKGVEANLPAGHALLSSVPLLSPAPGSTPGASTLTGEHQTGPPEQAFFEWTASTDPNFDHYELRFTAGSTYDSANDMTIASYPAGTLSAMTLDGLANPGDTASYKIYVVLNTGNEAGSNTVTLTRP